ncbi:MAG: hypothetical protein ACFFD2_19535 [Promethearchaeota archaeon]
MFSNEEAFQKTVIESLNARGFFSIVSGDSSAIDEYVVHVDEPFKIVVLIDFKY